MTQWMQHIQSRKRANTCCVSQNNSQVIDTVCVAGVLMDGVPDRWKESIFGARSLGSSKALCDLENQGGMFVCIHLRKQNIYTDNPLLSTQRLYAHTNKACQHTAVVPMWLPTAVGSVWFAPLIKSVWRWYVGYLLWIYIAKPSGSAPHQGHIWLLLTTCPNPQLGPISPLPSHYLPVPTEQALPRTSEVLWRYTGIHMGKGGCYSEPSWRNIGIPSHVDITTPPLLNSQLTTPDWIYSLFTSRKVCMLLKSHVHWLCWMKPKAKQINKGKKTTFYFSSNTHSRSFTGTNVSLNAAQSHWVWSQFTKRN